MILKNWFKKKKIFWFVLAITILLLIVGVVVFTFWQTKNPQGKSQAEIIQDQISQIDTEYGQKIVEVVGKQKENGCIAEKDVEVTVTLTGEKKIEKQWKTVSTEEVCINLQKQKDDLTRERSYKIGQLITQLDVLTARPEAERERRAKIVAAQGEFQAAEKLGQAADLIAAHPVALQLRTLQTMAEISVEKNSTIIFPAQMMTTVKEAIEAIKSDSLKR